MFIDSVGYGGAQKQFVCLSNLLKSKGYEVIILVVYSDFDFYRSSLNDIDIICDDKSRKPLNRLLRLPIFIAKQKPDVVISFLDSQCIIASLAKLLGKFKLIVSERNTTQELTRQEKIKFWLYRFADFIVPNSFSQGSFIKEHYPSLRSKVRVITNVISQNEFTPSKVLAPNHIPQIISVGRNVYQKNYLGMVETVKIIKDRGVKAHFVWYAGKYTDNYYLSVEKKISEYGLEDMISIYDPVKNIADKYRESDIFWIASFYEGFPNVLCEAMACGLPVVCSNVCDNGIIAENGKNGFHCSPDNPEDMAEQLIRMIEMPEEKVQQISHNNIKRIEELCSENAFINKYVGLIESEE